MNDRELLEKAAKASGYWNKDFDCYKGPISWDPLTDDGDALRLAVKLLFEIDIGSGCIAIRHSTGIKILEAFNHDPYAATRRAIVRAAATLGEQA